MLTISSNVNVIDKTCRLIGKIEVTILQILRKLEK